MSHMAETHTHPNSWYAASVDLPEPFPALAGDHETDVCVVGGGYTGLSAAIHLRQLGFRVCLLEAHRVGWGASGRNGGHVGTGQRADMRDIEKWVGLTAAKDLWRLGLQAVELVEALTAQFKIDCELGDGNLHLASKPSHARDAQQEVEHLRSVYGYDRISYLCRKDIAERTSGQGFYGGVLDSGARHLHPLKYALGLARAAQSLGVEIFEHSAVTEITSSPDVSLRTACGHVKARYAVLGCNGYLGQLEPRMAARIMPINNFVVATEPLSDALWQRINRDRTSMSDSLFVIDYWKLSADNRLLFGGGENYTRRFPADIKNFVRPYLLKIYPELANTAIDYGWGGTLAITMNRMPDFGILDDRIFYAQGFSGHGVPTATVAGKLIAQAIDGDCRDFDVFANVPTTRFPGGTLLRWPGLVVGMLFYSLLDKLGR